MPKVIEQVADIPRTISGKISEIAVRDVVHGRPVKNTDALEGALRSLLDDGKLRSAMGAAAAQRARERFDQQHQIDLILETYRRLLPERAPS